MQSLFQLMIKALLRPETNLFRLLLELLLPHGSKRPCPDHGKKQVGVWHWSFGIGALLNKTLIHSSHSCKRRK